MHREAEAELANCADCGSAVDVARERGYGATAEFVLCWQCATNRGAQYDENEDRWTVLPEMSGLPASEEFRER